MKDLTDYGRRLAASAGPITDEQAMETARILLSDERMAA